LKLYLLFTSPLYVSSYEDKDLLDIEFLNPMLFKSKKDGLILEPGYKMEGLRVP